MVFSDKIMKRAERHALRFAKRFKNDEDGATAIEFAFVALPFFALLFGILELAVIFFINSALVHATSEAGRIIRVGNFQNCGAQDEFRALVCENMNNMNNCSRNLRIDVVKGDSFSDIEFLDFDLVEPLEQDPVTGDTVIPQTANGQFDQTVAGDTIVVRSVLHYRLALPPLLTRLDSPRGSGGRTMIATTAFRNEPFPVQTQCNSSNVATGDI